MKPVYVVLLMVAAAIGGGLLVRYSDRPVQIAQARSTPPTVVAPPIPPTAHMGPSSSVPVHPPVPEKPSALSTPARAAEPDRAPGAPTIVARTRIPPEPPAVIPLERSTFPVPAPAPAPASSPVPPAAPAPPPPPAPAPEPEPNRVTLKPGTLLAVRITEALSSDRNVQGDVFTGTLDRPLVADGFVIAERGARVRGEVIDVKRAGRMQRTAELTIQVKEISTSDGQQVRIVTQPWRRQGTSSTGEDVAKIGGGAALGAIIGAVAGGGKGAGIGAGVGGAAGTGDVMLTRGHPAMIKPETSIPFRLERGVEITERR